MIQISSGVQGFSVRIKQHSIYFTESVRIEYFNRFTEIVKIKKTWKKKDFNIDLIDFSKNRIFKRFTETFSKNRIFDMLYWKISVRIEFLDGFTEKFQ